MRPELDLLIDCMRVFIGVADADRIHSILDSEFNWTFLIETALHHQVVPLLHQGLITAASDTIPEDIRYALTIFGNEKIKQNQIISKELVRITNHLDNLQIEILPFKGPTLAVQAYKDFSIRSCHDLDFLIHKQDYLAVINALRTLGYVNESWKTPTKAMASWEYYGQDILFSTEKGIAIEPHWSFAPSTFAINIRNCGLWQRKTTTTLLNQALPSLSPEDHLLVLCVHGCKERWIYLKQVCDVAGLIVNHPDINWSRLALLAKRQNCLRMLLIGLCITQKLLKIPLSNEITQLIAKDKTVISLSADIEGNIFQKNRPLVDIDKLNTFRLRMRDHWREGIFYVTWSLIMPSDRHFRMLTLPTGLFWLYIPIKLVHDYILLPLWLSWKWTRRSTLEVSRHLFLGK